MNKEQKKLIDFKKENLFIKNFYEQLIKKKFLTFHSEKWLNMQIYNLLKSYKSLDIHDYFYNNHINKLKNNPIKYKIKRHFIGLSLYSDKDIYKKISFYINKNNQNNINKNNQNNINKNTITYEKSKKISFNNIKNKNLINIKPIDFGIYNEKLLLMQLKNFKDNNFIQDYIYDITIFIENNNYKNSLQIDFVILMDNVIIFIEAKHTSNIVNNYYMKERVFQLKRFSILISKYYHYIMKTNTVFGSCLVINHVQKKENIKDNIEFFNKRKNINNRVIYGCEYIADKEKDVILYLSDDKNHYHTNCNKYNNYLIINSRYNDFHAQLDELKNNIIKYKEEHKIQSSKNQDNDFDFFYHLKNQKMLLNSNDIENIKNVHNKTKGGYLTQEQINYINNKNINTIGDKYTGVFDTKNIFNQIKLL